MQEWNIECSICETPPPPPSDFSSLKFIFKHICVLTCWFNLRSPSLIPAYDWLCLLSLRITVPLKVVGGADSSCFLAFVSPHELWSSFVGTFIWAASKLNAVSARQGCACIYVKITFIHLGVFSGSANTWERKEKNNILIKKIIIPPGNPRATQIWK